MTVVIATTHRASHLGTCLDRLLPQLAEIGGELVVADGSPRGDAVGAIDEPRLRVLRLPGAHVFELRAEGARAAKGAVVAFTEDHCVPDGAWAARILAAHAEHPTTAAVAGATRNGSPHARVNRANFLATFAPALPPLPPIPGRRVPPPNNVSIKAVALDEYELLPGLLELEIVPHLARVGHLVVDDRILVDHVQSHGRLDAVAVHFHNGRSTTGLPAPPRRRDVPRVVVESALLIPRHLAATVREVSRRPGQRRSAAPALPWLAALLVAHATGQVVGACAGPGRSPRALE